MQDAVDLDATAVADESTDTFISVDELQKMGINAADIAKLKSSGLSTVSSHYLSLSWLNIERMAGHYGVAVASIYACVALAARQRATGNFASTLCMYQSHQCYLHESSASRPDVQVGLILATPSKRLLEIKGISDAKLEKITEAAKKLKPTGFLTGTEALVQSKVRFSRSYIAGRLHRRPCS